MAGKKGNFFVKSKKGSSMVEAAVIFPLVILAVMAVIFILVFLFQEVTYNSRIHVALNATMGSETETVETYKNVPAGIKPYKSVHGIGECYYAESGLTFQKRGLLNKSFTKTLEGRVYSVDEKKFIRYTDFFSEVI